MSTESRCAAVLDGPHPLGLMERQGILFAVRLAVTPENISQPDRWPCHGFYLLAFSGLGGLLNGLAPLVSISSRSRGPLVLRMITLETRV